MEVNQAWSTLGLDMLSIDLAGETVDSSLTSAETIGFRSVLGQLLWLGQQSRPDLCDCVSLAAQRVSEATLSDVKALNKVVDQARSAAETGSVIHCGVVNLKTCSVICCADAAFANAEGETSQCGLVVGPTPQPEPVKTGRFDDHQFKGHHNQESRQIYTGGKRNMLCLLDRNTHGTQFSDER